MEQSDMYKEAMETMRHFIEAETTKEFYESVETETIKEISKQKKTVLKRTSNGLTRRIQISIL